MAIAQTAELIVEIIGKDLLSPATASAERGLSSMSGMSLSAAKNASTAEKALGLVGSAATGMGNALSHAKGFLGSLISGPLGMIGLGTAAFGAAGAIKEAISTANDMASAIEKLAPLTGDTAEQISSLIAVFNKFGIDTNTATARLAFMEKAVGNLTLTTAKAAAFQKEFGVSLVDASGHVKDANTLIALAADYWNGSASAAEKAAFEAKLFGRGFADMIPILNLGSKGILQAEQAAAQLGLTLNATNVKDLQAYQAQMRETGDVIGGLKLQIALALIPTITDLAKHFSAFVSDHRTDIVAFFKSAIAVSKEVGAALMSVGKFAANAWNAIPGPLRDLLIQALIGNKVIKTVFGINILGSVEGAVANMGKDILGKLVGSIFGKNIATPVVNIEAGVVNAGGGIPGVGGAAGGAEGVGAGAAAGLGGLTVAGATLLGGIIVAGIAAAIVVKNTPPEPSAGNFKSPTYGRFGSAAPTPGASLDHQFKDLGATTQTAMGKAADDIVAGSAHDAMAIGQRIAAEAMGIQKLTATAFSHLYGLTTAQQDAVTHNLQLIRIAAAEQHKVTYAQLLKDSHAAHVDHLNTLGIEKQQFAKAGEILKSNETTKQKVAELTGIQALFSKRGDTASAAKITADIMKLLYPLNAIKDGIAGLATYQNSNHPNPPAGTSHRSNTTAKSKSNAYGPVGREGVG